MLGEGDGEKAGWGVKGDAHFANILSIRDDGRMLQRCMNARHKLGRSVLPPGDRNNDLGSVVHHVGIICSWW